MPSFLHAQFFRFVSLLLASTSFGSWPIQAEESSNRLELGYPEYKIHSTHEIGTRIGGKFVTLDSNDRILFSSKGELSAFDGTKWSRVSIPKRRSKEDISFAKLGPDNRIYVGGLAYWGRLDVDEKGRYYIEFLSTDEQQFTFSQESFDQIAFRDDKVYFKGRNHLVEWSDAEGSKIWDRERLDLVFTRKNEIYISSKVGLEKLDDGELQPVALSQTSPRETRFMQATQWFDGRTALFDTQLGLVLFDGQTLENLPDAFENQPESNWAHAMEIFDSESIVLSVANKGVSFIDKEGKTILNLDGKLDHRFLDSTSITIAPDRSVWVALSDGAAQIISPYSFTRLDLRVKEALNYFKLKRLGERLIILNNGKLLIGNYLADGRLSGFDRFLKDEHIYDIVQFGSSVIIATKNAVFELKEDGSRERVASIPFVQRILVNEAKTEVLLASDDALNFVTRSDSGYKLSGSVDTPGAPNHLVKDAAGNIWLELGVSKVGRVFKKDEMYFYNEYGVSDGLTSDQWIPVWKLGQEVFFSSRKGPLKFNEKTERFETASVLNEIIPGKYRDFGRIAQAPNGDIWIAADKGILILRKKPNGAFIPDPKTLQFVQRQQIEQIQFEGKDTAWIISEKVLARVDTSQRTEVLEVPTPQLTSIQDSESGELLYHFNNSKLRFPQKLSHRRNNLQFTFNTPSYLFAGGVKYSYRLVGYSNNWSTPYSNSTISIERIPSGSYQLEVRAVVNDLAFSPPASITLNFSKPWFLTQFAIVLYFAATALIIAASVRFYHRKLAQKQRILEEKVSAQTKELREKNIQLKGAYLNERNLKRQAEQASEAKSDFLATVSHEIRTPMNCIIGLSDNLLSTPLALSQVEMLQTINSSGHSLVAIISDILDFSKIEAGKVEIEETVFSPSQAVRDVFNLFLPSSKEKHLEMRLNVSPDIPKWLLGDPTRIKQILINLVGNALKFTEKGEISVSLEQQKDESNSIVLYYSIEDTGVGIKAENMHRLFQAFSQVDSSNTRKYGGTGLGLAISKKLVELMKGNISVSSEEGQGSKFYFTVATRLPSKSEIAQHEKLESEMRDFRQPKLTENSYSPRPVHPFPKIQQNNTSQENAEILVVEDNPINQQVTGMMLQRIGYSYEIVGNGKFALERLSSQTYKAILMDIQMPDMDGLQCTREILLQFGEKAPPIIAATARSSDVDKTSALAAGMSAYLTKPLERAKLKKILEAEISAKGYLDRAVR